MNLKCLFKGHAWVKVGGPVRRGDRFEQRLKCARCGKIKMHRS